MVNATGQSISVSAGYQIKQLVVQFVVCHSVQFNCKMKLLALASVFVLAVATVSGEPPVRYHQFRRGSSFGRLQQAPPSFARQVADPPQGYDYPKPSGGYAYPPPEQPFPLPEEPAATTTVAPTTTELPTTTALPVDDYEDNATEDPETETVEAEAVAGQLRAARLRQARRRNGLAARLQQLEGDDDNQQQPQQPIYLVNIPESTLQRLLLLNDASAAYPAQLKLAPVPAAPVAAPLQVAPAPLQTPQVYITDYGLVYAKK